MGSSHQEMPLCFVHLGKASGCTIRAQVTTAAKYSKNKIKLHSLIKSNIIISYIQQVNKDSNNSNKDINKDINQNHSKNNNINSNTKIKNNNTNNND